MNEAAIECLLEALEDPAAPTTVHDRARAREVHVADSLAALSLAAVRSARVLADIGSGAGLPGLVLAAALPECRVVCVESVGRKAAFIAATAERCGLGNVAVVSARAEEWADGREACDVVTARAVASLAVLCEYAAPLLRIGGVVVCWKGAVDEVEEADGRAAAAALGLIVAPVVSVTPYPESLHRTLWVFEKVAPTPDRFPRRPGMATKRPLSAKTS